MEHTVQEIVPREFFSDSLRSFIANGNGGGDPEEQFKRLEHSDGIGLMTIRRRRNDKFSRSTVSTWFTMSIYVRTQSINKTSVLSYRLSLGTGLYTAYSKCIEQTTPTFPRPPLDSLSKRAFISS